MVLAIGQFRVSKYAESIYGGGGAAPGGIGIPGVADSAGNYNLVPGNTFPQIIGPGGEIIPGVGGSPFLPGGVPMTPAYAGGPMWDLQQGGFDYGIHELPGRGRGTGKRFGSRILNVNLPKLVTAGQAFVIIVTYTHSGAQFGEYKLKVTLPALQIVETTASKRIMGQDSVPINLTAPAPLPAAPVTGTVELIQTEGNDVTIDSEVITIPTEAVPNPPIPMPPPDEMPPTPPPVSEPPVVPPAPPVPLPPVLQQVNINVVRGEDGGFQAIIITASNLEPSEPCTVFVYLSQKEFSGDGVKPWRIGKHKFQFDHEIAKTQTTPAGSVATANVAYAYPSVSVGGMTSMGNGIKMTSMPKTPSMNMSNMPNTKTMGSSIFSKTKSMMMAAGMPSTIATPTTNAVMNAVSAGKPAPVVIGTAAATAVASAGGTTAIANAAGNAAVAAAGSGGGAGASANAGSIGGAVAQAVAGAGGTQTVAMAAGAAAAAAASSVGDGGAVAVAGGGVPPLPSPLPPPVLPPKPIFKRQRVSITASPEGTIRHVVRVREATPGMPLFGFVIVYGHRSKRHTGRRQFSL